MGCTIYAGSVEALKAMEGKRIDAKGMHIAYKDSVGIWTIGYGETDPKIVAKGKITEKEATQLLTKKVVAIEKLIASLVKVEVSKNQKMALVCFIYNVGVNAFKNSTLLIVLNQGNYEAVTAQIAKWNKGTINGKKVVIAGLVNRRTEEIKIWNA